MYGSKLYFMCSVGVAFTLFTMSRIASTNEDAIFFYFLEYYIKIKYYLAFLLPFVSVM